MEHVRRLLWVKVWMLLSSLRVQDSAHNKDWSEHNVPVRQGGLLQIRSLCPGRVSRPRGLLAEEGETLEGAAGVS